MLVSTPKYDLLESVTPIQQVLDLLPSKTPWAVSGDSVSSFSFVVYSADLWNIISNVECKLGRKLDWEIGGGIAETTIGINGSKEFTLSIVYEEKEYE